MAAPASPAHPVRHDGWTASRRRVFLETLAERGSVRVAALAAGKSTTAAYNLRARAGEAAFANAWDAALLARARSLEDLAFERAVDGWEEAVFAGGKQVGIRNRTDNRLLRWLLERSNPFDYGRDNSLREPNWSRKAPELLSIELAKLEDEAAE